MKKNPLFKKLRGYQKAPRDRFYLLHMGILTTEEFVVYEFGIAITDWDDGPGHDEIYGKFQATNKQIAEVCGWKSDSQVSRIRNKLIEKGFFIKEGEQFRVKGFEKWQLRKNPLAKTQANGANPQSRIANLQGEVAKMQDFQTQNPDYPLISSKGKSGLFPIGEEIGNSEEVSLDDIPF